MGRFSNQVLCRLYQRRELRILTPCAYLQIWICQKICMNQNPNSFGIVFTTKIINLRRFTVTILNSLHCNLRPPFFPSLLWYFCSVDLSIMSMMLLPSSRLAINSGLLFCCSTTHDSVVRKSFFSMSL